MYSEADKSTTPSLDESQVIEWLSMFLDSPGYLVISSPLSWSGRAFDVNDADVLDRTLAYIRRCDADNPKGIYLRTTTTSRIPEEGKRGSRQDSQALTGFWLDMDIAGPGHKDNRHNNLPLPPDEKTCRTIVAHAGIPEPTLWIHSGGGLYPWWMFKQPLDVSTPEAQEHWESLSQRFHQVIARGAADLGWRYDTSTYDLPRILRIPGTVNRKVEDHPTQARFFHRDVGGATFTPSELEEHIKGAEELWPAPEVNAPPTFSPSAPSQKAALASAGIVRPGDDFIARCDFLGLLRSDGWRILKHTTEGYELVRPGSDSTDLHATFGRNGSNNLYVFSDFAGLPVREPLSAYAYWAHTRHGSDFKAATKDLGAQGYGTPLQPTYVSGFGDSAPVANPARTRTWDGAATIPDEANSGEEVVYTPVVQPASPSVPADPPPPSVGQTHGRPYVIRKHSLTDSGNAARLADRLAGSHVLVSYETNQWLTYNGQYWALDTKYGIRASRLIRQTLHRAFDEERHLHSEEVPPARNGKIQKSEREKFEAWVHTSSSEATINAARRLLASEEGMGCELGEFDADPYKINVANGYLDLRTGELEPHSPEHRCRNYIPLNYDPNATSDKWNSCLDTWVPDEEMRTCLQRVMGYTLSGDVSEQALYIHTGTGSNGKSVFFSMMRTIMGNYAQSVPRQALMLQRHGSNASPEVARMLGKRLLLCSELKQGEVLDAAAAKGLTGQDRQVARGLYSDFIEFDPTGKLHFVTNHPPQIPDDDASWRRIWLFKWSAKIANGDKHLAGTLAQTEHAQAILAWLVAGFQDYLNEGLEPPQAMQLQVEDWREREDLFGDFLTKCVEVVEPTQPTLDDPTPAPVQTTTETLFAAYRMWVDKSGIDKPMHIVGFARAMAERGFERWRSNARRGFVGVQLRNSATQTTGTWIRSGADLQ